MGECPICLDELDLTDLRFKPCKCGYQMCRFCWNHINENLNGKCPACRQPYKTENYKFTPPNPEEIQKIQNAKKAKERERKHAEANARKNLANVRVIQRNLVYLTNLAVSAATEEVLKRSDYFGKFGKIKKTVVNRNNVYQGPQGPSVSAYITYYKNSDAHAAIKAVDGTLLDGRLLRASFGTTKYCSFFLKNVRCPNPDCMYLHELGNEVDSFTKEDMAQGKHLLSNITLNPEEYNEQQKAVARRDTKNHTNSGGRTKTNGAWKTVAEPPPLALEPPSLNPEEWPDALGGTGGPQSSSSSTTKKKKSINASQNRSNDQYVSEPPVAVGTPTPQKLMMSSSALPPSASWASKAAPELNEEDDRQQRRHNLATSTPISNRTKQHTNHKRNDTPKNTRPTKKKQSEWRNSASVGSPPHHDEGDDPYRYDYTDTDDSDSDDKGTSPSSNQTVNTQNDLEDVDEFDDGIDNATYDEHMSRLSLADCNRATYSEEHSDEPENECDINDVGYTNITPLKNINNDVTLGGDNNNTSHINSSKNTNVEQTSTTTQATNYDSCWNVNDNESLPCSPPGFDSLNQQEGEDIQTQQQSSQIQQPYEMELEHWLRVNFSGLSIGNSNENLLWSSPFPFLGSPTTKSRFDFARTDDITTPNNNLIGVGETNYFSQSSPSSLPSFPLHHTNIPPSHYYHQTTEYSTTQQQQQLQQLQQQQQQLQLQRQHNNHTTTIQQQQHNNSQHIHHTIPQMHSHVPIQHTISHPHLHTHVYPHLHTHVHPQHTQFKMHY